MPGGPVQSPYLAGKNGLNLLTTTNRQIQSISMQQDEPVVAIQSQPMMRITAVRLMARRRWGAMPHRAFSAPTTKPAMLQRCLIIKCFRLVAVTPAMRMAYHIDMFSIANTTIPNRQVRDFESSALRQSSKTKTIMEPMSII